VGVLLAHCVCVYSGAVLYSLVFQVFSAESSLALLEKS
jgi:hypothetical protein